MPILILILVGLAALPIVIVSVVRPGRTIIPLYAALVAGGSAVKLAIPLPKPFNTLSTLIGAVATVAIVTHVLVYRRGRIPTPPLAAWLLFLAWYLVTVFWAADLSEALDQAAIALPLIFLLVAVSLVPASGDDIDVFRMCVVLGGAAVGVYAVVLVLTGTALPTHGVSERFSLVTTADETNPNQLAASLLFPLVLSIDMVVRGAGPWLGAGRGRRIGAFAGLLTAAAIVLTGSRGAIVALVPAIATLLVLSWRWNPDARRRVLRTIVGSLAILAVVVAAGYVAVRVSPQGALARVLVSDPIGRLAETESRSGRTEIWATGYLACRRSCGVGVGLGNFAETYLHLFPFSGTERNVGLHRPAHNMYLSIAVEAGFIGLALFTMALLAEWLALRRLGTVGPALGAAAVGVLAANIFEGFLWFKLFWLPFMAIHLAEGAAADVRPPRASRRGEAPISGEADLVPRPDRLP